MLPRKTASHSVRGSTNELATRAQQSDALFGLVRANSLYERPIPERHRSSSTWGTSRHSIGICFTKTILA